MKYIKKGIVIGMTLLMTTLMGTGNIIAKENTEKVGTDLYKVKQIDDYKQLITLLEEQGHFYTPGEEMRGIYEYDATEANMIKTEAVAEVAMDDRSYSKTNVQVEGVEEADTVKLDGRYIYTCLTNSIAIVDTKKEMKQVASIKCNIGEWERYHINKIFLEDNYLVVLLQGTEYRDNNQVNAYWSYGDHYTGLCVYNIQDKSTPKLVRSLKVEGYLEKIRMIDKQLYLVTERSVGRYEKEKYDLNDILPKYKDSAISNEIKPMPAKGICYFVWSGSDSYTIMTSLDISKKEAARYNVLLGNINEMYMNEKAIYLTQSGYDSWKCDSYFSPDQTYILKYNINKGVVSYKACSSVKGTLLNQFSMDENNGYFRIATTDSNRIGNNVYVLDIGLNIIGKLEGLAQGESIYSVRFQGDRGYVVTFEQIDPLFVLDLSNPKQPKVLGELEVPGFSQYLHPIADNLVVGIGRATGENVLRDEEGNERVTGVYATGIKLSLFDVKDPKMPKEINHVIIGGRYSDSLALQDHTAVMVDKDRQILAIPVYLEFEGPKKITDTVSLDYFSGAYVFGIENGKLIGKAKLGKVNRETGEYMNCHYSSDTERICYIGNTMYYVYNGQINAYDLDSFKRLQVIELK